MKRAFLVLSALMLAVSICSAADRLTVMSFNIRNSGAGDGANGWIFRREAAVGAIVEIAPDLLGIQEGLPDQIEYLDHNLGGFAREGVGRDNGSDSGEMMAIYWRTDRFEKIDGGTFWLSETPDSVSYGWDAACRRTVTWVRLRDRSTNRTLCFFNTHLDHVGVTARTRSIELIVERIGAIADAGDAVVLSGDFNSGVEETLFDPLKSALTDARAASPVTDSRPTYNGFDKSSSGSVIDHIFLRGLKPIRFETIDRDYSIPYLSDHYPIVCVTEL